jgi:Yip1 domain
MDPNAVINHLLRLVRLDTTVFDEVRDDPRELIPSLVVAGVACLLAGLGALLWWAFVIDSESVEKEVVNTLILGTVFLALMYGIGSVVVYVTLTTMFKSQVDLQALIRCMGYAAWPLGLSVLMFVPVIYPIFAYVPLALLLVSMIYAAQSASGADSRDVVVSCLIGFTAMVFILGIIGTSSKFPDATMGAGVFTTISDGD